MAFGQASGPPAGGRQIEHLAELFERAGFGSFREARHPFGLTQRQAGGKFTVPEVEELIERLEAAQIVQQGDVDPSPAAGQPAAARSTVPRRPAPRTVASADAQRARDRRRAELLAGLDDAVIVAELERRGWCCIPPLADEA